jgi:thioredoxin 1
MSAVRLLVVLLLLGLAGCGSDGSMAARVDQALASGRPTLLEFGANSCSQCRKMSAVMAALAPRFAGRADLIQVDVGNEYDLTRRFKVIVIPTLVFFDTAGREVGRHHGFLEETKVAQILGDLGAH